MHSTLCRDSLKRVAMDILKEFRFKRLTIPERAELLEAKGMYLAVRSFFSFDISLYVIGDVFVEVWYNYHVDEVLCIEHLDSEKVPDHYPQVLTITRGGISLRPEKQERDYLCYPFTTREERWESDRIWIGRIGAYGLGLNPKVKAESRRYRIRRLYLFIRKQWRLLAGNIFKRMGIA